MIARYTNPVLGHLQRDMTAMKSDLNICEGANRICLQQYVLR